jgi:hypothetical protein
MLYPSLMRLTRHFVIAISFCLLLPALSEAADLDWIGVMFLRSLDPTLTGSNISVAQPEASVSETLPLWEVNPALVGQPTALFAWISSSGSASSFPNAVGGESFHANNVGLEFYAPTSGVAPGVIHVDNYEAGFFVNSRVKNQTAISAKVVNQSFNLLTSADVAYDNYAARYGTLFLTGVGNGGAVNSPATCYNGMGVAAYGGGSSIGPTSDGRSKPDITAPAPLTSFSTPQAAGAAAVLLQAANRNDGGAGTAADAGDMRTIKALLLNGAEKTLDWTHTVLAPLDTRYGAGILHVWNSYRHLRGGKQPFAVSISNGIGGGHPPPAVASNAPTRRGWDLASIANSPNEETVNHYFFDLRSASNRVFTLKATLVWIRQQNKLTINDLDLFLYDAVTSNLVASSQSLVDNVEHLYVTNLPPARYNLQVLKNGGAKRTTTSETYALAFEFGPPEEARLANARMVSGQFQAEVVGEPNQNYAVDQTTNFAAWTPIITNRTTEAGSFTFTNSNGVASFYRARLVP